MRTKPKIQIDLAKVESLGAQGLTNAQIAAALGISETTLYNNQRNSAEFEAAIKKGKAKGIALATNKLFEKIRAGDLGAICFFLKCRGEWSEKLKLDHSSTDGSMSPLDVKVEFIKAKQEE